MDSEYLFFLSPSARYRYRRRRHRRLLRSRAEAPLAPLGVGVVLRVHRRFAVKVGFLEMISPSRFASRILVFSLRGGVGLGRSG